jgi:ABC-type uncharacterized transport system auxiliary subunit
MHERLAAHMAPAGLLALAALVALVTSETGCAGRPAPAISHYRLELGEPAPLAEPALDGVLLVQRPRADAFTSQRSLAYRELGAGGATTALYRFRYHLWVDPPPQMLEQEIVRYLRTARAAPSVVTAELRTQADYVLHTRLRRLEQTRGPAGVSVAVDFDLVRGDGELLLQESQRVELPVEGEEIGAYVDALNAALRSILDRLLEALRAARAPASLSASPPGTLSRELRTETS